ncbi:MAG: LTA synthase family protein [Leptonema sp. (in: bacteria)]
MENLITLIVPTNTREYFKNVILGYIGILFFLWIQRVIFFIFYYSENKKLEVFHFLDILIAFLIGIRFDLAVVPIFFILYHFFLFLFLLLYQIKKIPFSFYKSIAFLIFFLQWVFIIFLLFSNFSSILNYGVNNKFLGWEYFAYFKDLPIFLRSIFSKNPLATIFLFLLLFFWILMGLWIVRKGHLYTRKHVPSSYWKGSFFVYFLFYLVLSVIFLRGGIQESPLRPANALTSKSNFLNHLKLNGIFTILWDFSDAKDFRIFYPIKENIEFTREFLRNSDSYVSESYPLIRYKKPKKIVFPKFKTIDSDSLEKPYNFILILLESWSAKFLEIYNYPEPVTPNLNQLIKKGVFFKNFYASGGRSANGIFCILTGLPDRAGRTIFRSNQIFNQFGSLPLLLKEKGYSTIFLHSGDLEFDNLKNALPHLGFDILIGKQEMEKANQYTKKWAMGFFDEDLYDISWSMVNSIQEPFFMMIFTSNNHHPFTVPDPKFEVFPETTSEYKFKNSYYYADYALGEFIRKIENSKFIKNTILLLVADHTHHTNLNFLEDRQIPFLVYSPYLFQGEIRLDTSSQLDILPTILSLSGGNFLYSAIGRDLTEQSQDEFKDFHPFAFFAGGSNTDIIGIVYYPYIAYHYFHSKEKFLFRIDQEISLTNIAQMNPNISTKMDFIIKNIYQFSRYLEKNNLVWPNQKEYLELKNKLIQY